MIRTQNHFLNPLWMFGHTIRQKIFAALFADSLHLVFREVDLLKMHPKYLEIITQGLLHLFFKILAGYFYIW